MSRNLVKSYFTIQEGDEPRVIDSNTRIEEKLERIRYIMPQVDFAPTEFGEEEVTGEFVDGIGDPLDMLMSEDYVPDAEGTGMESNVIKANPEPVGVSQADIEELEAMRDRMIQEAEADIAVMKNMAANEIATSKTIAYEEGRNEGYQKGISDANAEAARIRAQLEEERARIDQMYEERIVDLEPEFVRILTNIYEQVFKVDLSEDRQIVVNLLRNAMQRIEGTKNYIIHVSRDDYPYVSENKQMLIDACQTQDSTVDLVEDITMRSGECMIETDGGIYDCSLDTQLAALRKKLILLSYDGREE